MSAKIICMASAKGGSGKTVLTATFATFIARLGKKVLLIDTDAATNGLTLLFLKEVMLQGEVAIGGGRKPKGIFELSADNTGPEIVTIDDGLFLIPATYAFINTEYADLDIYKKTLSNALLSVIESYDYIFLDAQAGSDPYAYISMSRTTSHEVIIVSEYDPMSAAGVERLKALFREDLTYVRTWVLLNKMLPDFVKSFSDFLEVAKYLSPVPWDSDVVKAYARRRLALDMENGNEFTLAIAATLKSLLGEDIEGNLDHWVSEKATAIRQPIEDQYLDIEKELMGLMQEEQMTKSKIIKRDLILRTGIFIPLSVLLGVSVHIITDFNGKPIEELIRQYLIPIVSSIMAVAALAILPTLLRKRGIPEIDIRISEARLHRRKEMLEDKLRKLETLRSADLETLIKLKK